MPGTRSMPNFAASSRSSSKLDAQADQVAEGGQLLEHLPRGLAVGVRLAPGDDDAEFLLGEVVDLHRAQHLLGELLPDRVLVFQRDHGACSSERPTRSQTRARRWTAVAAAATASIQRATVTSSIMSPMPSRMTRSARPNSPSRIGTSTISARARV